MDEKLIAVIGGTGKSGKYVVKDLLRNGYRVKLLVRNPANAVIKTTRLELLEGNVSDYETIRLFTKGCDAIISTLGIGQPHSEPTIFSTSTRHILKAMDENETSRYIVTTGVNVDTPLDKKGSYAKTATDWMKANFPKSTADRQTEYDLLAGTKLDWTLVRLPMIEFKDEVKEVLLSLEDCPGEKINSSSLAKFLIEQLFDQRYLRQAPFLADRDK
jgi:putative NADH-flavin reductase